MKLIMAVTIPGKPEQGGQMRVARFGNFVRAYTPSKIVNYKAYVRLCVAEAMEGRPPATGAVKVVIRSFRKIPKASKKKAEAMKRGELRPITRPDVDNTVKVIFDALSTVAYRDDAQVVDYHPVKWYDDGWGERVEIEVFEF